MAAGMDDTATAEEVPPWRCTIAPISDRPVKVTTPPASAPARDPSEAPDLDAPVGGHPTAL